MPITDPCALLDRLLKEPGESNWLEFKTNNSDPDEIGQYVSALANGAMLAGRDRAFLVFGVEDASRRTVGTTVKLSALKKGGENFANYLSRMLTPRLMVDMVDFECRGTRFAIIAVEPTFDRPVAFAGVEFIRIGENKKRLSEFPEHERAIWFATGRRKFENAVALSNQSLETIFDYIDPSVLFELQGRPEPLNQDEVVRQLARDGYQVRWP